MSLREGARVVESVDRLRFGAGQECTFIGALSAALRARGLDASYEQWMGISGCCYRLALSQPDWDFSSVDGLIAYDFLKPTLEALPCSAAFHDRAEGEARERAREDVLRSLDQGRPSIAINLRVVAEWGVIAGYAEGGKTLLCRTYFDGDAQDYLPAESWPFLLLVLGDPRPAPSPLDLLKRSLRVALDVPRHQGLRPNYANGLAVYKLWAFDLRDEARYAGGPESLRKPCEVNRFVYTSLLDARRAAAVYLGSRVELLSGEAAERLSEAARRYARLADALESGLETVPCPQEHLGGDVTRWTPQLRHAQADVLRDALHLEMEALDAVHRTLQTL